MNRQPDVGVAGLKQVFVTVSDGTGKSRWLKREELKKSGWLCRREGREQPAIHMMRFSVPDLNGCSALLTLNSVYTHVTVLHCLHSVESFCRLTDLRGVFICHSEPYLTWIIILEHYILCVRSPHYKVLTSVTASNWLRGWQGVKWLEYLENNLGWVIPANWIGKGCPVAFGREPRAALWHYSCWSEAVLQYDDNWTASDRFQFPLAKWCSAERHLLHQK